MALARRSRMGPYEIVALLGEGGMGEVYRARDTRLDRTVAIKCSKDAFTDRFEREARAVAALNHPNICQLYDVGPNYIVMEFVEGAPVASCDTPRKLLDIATQIADGLAAAHAAGILHRDLKPDNILMTREGRVKLLDFGLAKTVTADGPASDATRTIAITDAGTTIGTIAYMSPEQARGNATLTPQSDQFSLGLVLYELAAGQRAFRRDSAAEIMTAIIREEADPLPASVPAPLKWIIERLLAKDPADRYDSTRDLYRELRQIRERLYENTGSVPPVSVGQPAKTSGGSRVWPAAAVIALLAGAIGWMIRPSGAGTANYRFTPMEVSWENPLAAIWSPDGKAFTYVAGAVGDRHIFVRYLNSPTPAILTRAGEDWYVSGWSSDGKRVIARGKNPNQKARFALFAVPVFGGDPVFLMSLDSPFLPFPRVSEDGKLLVAAGTDDRKFGVYVSSPMGAPFEKYTPAPFETTTSFNNPLAKFTPGNRGITLVLDTVGGRQLWNLPYPPGNGAPERIMKDLTNLGSSPRWSWFADGHSGLMSLADAQGEHLWFADLRRGPVRKLMAGTPGDQELQPAISPDGTKLLFVQSRTDYMIVSASLSDGTVKRVLSSELPTGMPAWAAHRQEFVYNSLRNGSPGIWMRSESGDRALVGADAFPPGSTNDFGTPALSPNADRVLYAREDDERQGFNWISAVNGGPPVRVTSDKGAIELGGAWSPDGKSIVYWKFHDNMAAIMTVKATGEAAPTLLRDHVLDPLPEWSPDGRWIAFEGLPGAGGWSVISPDGKTIKSFGEPHTIQMTFSADSAKLYGIRVEPDRSVLYSIDIANGVKKEIGDLSKDFTPSSYTNPGIRLSLAPDGKSILYPARRVNSGLWMLEGYDRPGWLDRFH